MDWIGRFQVVLVARALDHEKSGLFSNDWWSSSLVWFFKNYSSFVKKYSEYRISVLRSGFGVYFHPSFVHWLLQKNLILLFQESFLASKLRTWKIVWIHFYVLKQPTDIEQWFWWTIPTWAWNQVQYFDYCTDQWQQIFYLLTYDSIEFFQVFWLNRHLGSYRNESYFSISLPSEFCN